MKIEKLSLYHKEHFKQIADDLMDGKYNIDKINEFIEDESSFAFIAIDEKVVGLVYGYILKRLNSDPMFYIHSVEVLKNYRRKGLGFEMMEKSINYALDKNCYKGFLITNKSNEKACKLYEKVNGKVIYNDDVVYEWKK